MTDRFVADAGSLVLVSSPNPDRKTGEPIGAPARSMDDIKRDVQEKGLEGKYPPAR